MEFLRQWQPSRLAVGVALSIVLHLAVIAALMGGRLPLTRYDVKRGEPLMVELPKAPDASPPPGQPGTPTPAPAAAPAPAAPPAPKASPAPPAPPRVAKAPAAPPAPRPAERPPAPRTPEPERRVATAPPPAPSGQDPAPAPKVTEPPRAAPEADKPQVPPTAAPAAPAGERQVASLPPPSSGSQGSPDIRTALRRGTGGAGGSGDGRAGIEGEPIPLDSTDPRYSDYLDRVRKAIKEKWGYPCVKDGVTHQCEYKTAQLVIEFGIAKNGTVPFITVMRSSGFPIYDDYAVNAVKLANFPPIPDSFSKKGVPILATFSYVVESSLTNILR
jgi:outer membrane biosynthesis protein TonB